MPPAKKKTSADYLRTWRAVAGRRPRVGGRGLSSPGNAARVTVGPLARW